jgi:hypothetical protein
VHLLVNEKLWLYQDARCNDKNYSRSFGAVVLFRNMVSRRIFAPNMEEVIGHQRKLCNKDIHTVFSSQHIMRVLKGGK